MKIVSENPHELESSTENVTLNNNTHNTDIQSHQTKLPHSVETDEYSKKGFLIQGNSKFFPFRSFIIDLSIVLISIFLMNFLRYGTLSLGISQTKLLYFYLTVWLFISIFFDKFHISSYQGYIKDVKFIFIAWLSTFFLVINFLVIFEIYTISRFLLFGIALIHFVLELMSYSIYYIAIGGLTNRKPFQQKEDIKKDNHFSIRRIIFDFLAFVVSILLINYLKHDTLKLSNQFEGLITVTCGVWFVSGIFTRKFELRNYANIYYKISPFIKSFLIHFSLMTIILFAFRLYLTPWVLLLGSIILLLFIELLAIFVKNLSVLVKGQNGDISSYSEIADIFNREESQPIAFGTNLEELLHLEVTDDSLQDYLKHEKSLHRFLKKHIELSTIDQRTAKVLNTTNLFNIKTLENHSLSLLINLHKINDFRYLNRYFIMAHQKIHKTGIFIGQAHTINTHKEWLNNKFPKFMVKLLYPFDFIYRRVFPKLPKIRKLYFYLTKGKRRIISKTEVLGRLCFCGFKIIAWDVMDNRLYFIAQRIQHPAVDKNPSYSPLIKLRRIGLHGKIIYIRKFRTMYPYAEYIQDTIFEKNKLNSNGKFDNDFRITEWGKWFRKLWIDELPQIINFWQGDINLVGVRALSFQYFNLYPEDLKKLRTQFKPGLIPPYYVDLPKSFDEIVASERRYLKLKMEKPFTTDVKYFLKAAYNIIFKRARSR